VFDIRHTIGTQLTEGGARIRTIMAALGHRTPNMSIIYASLSNPLSTSSTKTPSIDTSDPSKCDLVLTCSKFLTTSDYTPRLRARLAVEQQLIDDATERGWQREVERHTATQRRIEQLLSDLC